MILTIIKGRLSRYLNVGDRFSVYGRGLKRSRVVVTREGCSELQIEPVRYHPRFAVVVMLNN